MGASMTDQDETAELDADQAAPPVEKSIHQRMAEVAASVAAVSKGGTQDDQQYKYRKYDDVITALHGPLGDAGIFMEVRVDQWESERWPYYKSDSWSRLTGQVTVVFHGAEGDSMSMCQWAQALDNGDKGLGKLTSYAMKDILSRTFSLPFDDPSMDTEHMPQQEEVPREVQLGWTSTDVYAETTSQLWSRMRALKGTPMEDLLRSEAKKIEADDRGSKLLTNANIPAKWMSISAAEAFAELLDTAEAGLGGQEPWDNATASDELHPDDEMPDEDPVDDDSDD